MIERIPSGPEIAKQELTHNLDMFLGMSAVSIPPTKIVLTDAKDFRQRFPAYVEMLNDGSARMMYHPGAIEDLAETYDDTDLYNLVERIYVAGGLITAGIFRQVQDLDSDSLTQLHNAITDVDTLCTLINEDDSLNRETQNNLNYALIRSDRTRKVAMGFLRLTTGICSVLYEESAMFEVMQHQARFDLFNGIRDYQHVQDLYRGGNYTEEEALRNADIRFKDSITELTIALCYPMHTEEIRRILRISQQEQSHFSEETGLDTGDLDGFTEEGGPA